MAINGNFECFQYFNSETDFLENENLFQKTVVAFLVESTQIKNTLFAYKTFISETNVKTNRMVSTKCITKNGVLPVTTLFFEDFVEV